MSDTSLQPGPWREQVHPCRKLQPLHPQPLAGSPEKAKGGSANLVMAPRDRSQWRLSRGRAAAASAWASPLPLFSCLPHFWHGFAWLPAPGTGQWAGGLCCCDLAPSRLPITRGRQPKEQSWSLKCNLWLSGEYRADRRGLKQSVFGHRVHPPTHTKCTRQF